MLHATTIGYIVNLWKLLVRQTALIALRASQTNCWIRLQIAIAGRTVEDGIGYATCLALRSRTRQLRQTVHLFCHASLNV